MFLGKSGVVTEKCQPFDASLTETDSPQCIEQCRDEENFETRKHFGESSQCMRQSLKYVMLGAWK